MPTTATIEVKSFDSPDETRPFEGKGQAEIVTIAGQTVGRATFEPGWRWSECVKPVVGTDSCQAHHVGACQSGRLTVRHEDGTEVEIGPGDAYEIQPGHDAWVVGDEPWVTIDFSQAMADYAKPS